MKWLQRNGNNDYKNYINEKPEVLDSNNWPVFWHWSFWFPVLWGISYASYVIMLLFMFCIYVFVCMYLHSPIPWSHAEIRGQLLGIKSVILPCWYWSWTEVIRHNSKCFHMLSHLAGATLATPKKPMANTISQLLSFYPSQFPYLVCLCIMIHSLTMSKDDEESLYFT